MHRDSICLVATFQRQEVAELARTGSFVCRFILFFFSLSKRMAPKKDTTKKSSAIVGKKITPKLGTQSSAAANVVKRDKLVMSFNANANLNNAALPVAGSELVWLSKVSMIKCGLTYGDTVIVQTMVDGNRIFASRYSIMQFRIAASVRLDKGLKESEVLCSETLFRCISHQMGITPVTIFRLTPNSLIVPAERIIISVLQ